MKVKKVPQRMCVGCKEMKNKRDLLRIVRTPGGEIVWDKTGKKPGRGAYICPTEICFNKAYKEKRLERIFAQPIDVSVYETLRQNIAAEAKKDVP